MLGVQCARECSRYEVSSVVEKTQRYVHERTRYENIAGVDRPERSEGNAQ